MTGCGPLREHVSQPSICVQQLSVTPNGKWDVQLRIQNYNTIPIHIDHMQLQLLVQKNQGTSIAAAPTRTFGAQSIEVVTLSVQPSALEELYMENLLEQRRSISYVLQGTITVHLDKKSQRQIFHLTCKDQLDPSPGLQGVFR